MVHIGMERWHLLKNFYTRTLFPFSPSTNCRMCLGRMWIHILSSKASLKF